MRKVFRIIPAITSTIFACFGLFLYSCFGYALLVTDTAGIALVILGGLGMALLALFGWLGLMVGIKLDRRYRVQLPFSPVRLAVLLAACFALGAVGQTLYALEVNTTEEVVEIVDDPGQDSAPNHIFLLMDQSGSMSNCLADCVDAASQLVDFLNEDNFMQYAPFSQYVQDYDVSEMMPMTGTNKALMKTFIKESARLRGNTNFEVALRVAATRLLDAQAAGYRDVIVILTDGRDLLSDAFVKEFQDQYAGIELYVVRLESSTSTPSQRMLQKLAEIAKEITTVQKDASGKVDIQEVLKAFQNAVAPTIHTEIITHKNLQLRNQPILLNYGFDTYLPIQKLVPILVFAAYGLLVGLLYFGKQSGAGAAASVAIGAVTGICRSFIGYFGWPLMLLMAAFVRYQEMEVEFDV